MNHPKSRTTQNQATSHSKKTTQNRHELVAVEIDRSLRSPWSDNER